MSLTTVFEPVTLRWFESVNHLVDSLEEGGGSSTVAPDGESCTRGTWKPLYMTSKEDIAGSG